LAAAHQPIAKKRRMAAKRQIITLKNGFGIRFFFLAKGNVTTGKRRGDANIIPSPQDLVLSAHRTDAPTSCRST
jgi:hypothetical protein